MSLGPFATPTQVAQAICSDARHSTEIPIESSAYRISALYYGWKFGIDPTTELTNGGCSTTSTTNTGTQATSASPAASVKSFYQAAAEHRYATAWALADSNMRAQLGGYSSFENEMSPSSRNHLPPNQHVATNIDLSNPRHPHHLLPNQHNPTMLRNRKHSAGSDNLAPRPPRYPLHVMTGTSANLPTDDPAVEGLKRTNARKRAELERTAGILTRTSCRVESRVRSPSLADNS